MEQLIFTTKTIDTYSEQLIFIIWTIDFQI